MAFRARFGQDWPVIISPLIDIRDTDPGPVPADADGIVFTSQNAVHAFARLTADRSLKAWCVGRRTADAAREAGFDVTIGPGDGEGLARVIISSGQRGPVVYPRGTTVAVDMEELLGEAGVDVLPMVVYDQVECLPCAEALGVMGGQSAVLLPLFSPRSALIAAAVFRDHKAPLLVAAISVAVADSAAQLAGKHVAICTRPNAEAMLETLAALIDAADMA